MANTIAKLAVIITGDASPLSMALAQAGTSVKSFAGSMSLAGGSSAGMLSAMAGSAGFAGVAAAATAATAAVAGFASVGIRAAASLEQAQISFEVMTGSAAQATSLLSQIRTMAADTPFNFLDITQAAKTLVAMGEDIRVVMDDIKMLGDVSAGTGQPLNELAQVFGQVMQAGRLTGNELRQFNERGVPLLTTLSEMLGVTKMAIREMVEEGTVGSDLVVQAFEKMSGAGGRFENMMVRQTDTLVGQWEKFKENLTIIALEVMKPLVETLKSLLHDINMALEGLMQLMGIERDRSKIGSGDKARAEQRSAAEAAKAEADRTEMMKEQDKIAQAIQSRAQSVINSLRTPAEIFRETIAELRSLSEAGAISEEIFARGFAKATEQLEKANEAKRKLLDTTSFRVGAAERFTTAGFSAVQQGQGQLNRIAEFEKQQLVEAKKAAGQRDNQLAAIRNIRSVNLTPSNL